MLFPIRDSVPSRTRPVVTVGIVIACGLVWLYEVSLGDRLPVLFQAAAFIPARLFDGLLRVPAPEPDYGLIGNAVTVVTSIFMHGGWLHVIGNMWFLYVFGDNVEDVMGHLRFLLFYLGGGVAATLTHALIDPASPIPLVGASGAIAAVLGAYLVLFPRSRVHTLVFFITIVELPAPVFLGFWFILQFFQGTLWLASASAAGVAWFAHVGGFVFGAAIAWWMKQRGTIKPPTQRYHLWYRH